MKRAMKRDMSMNPWCRIVAVVALLLTGCAANTITGRSQLMLVSEEHAISGSAAAYSSMIGQLSKKNKVEVNGERVERVKQITNRLVPAAVRFRPDAAKWTWEVQVIDEPKVVNAFCMAGGKMGIYSGFWEKLKASDDEIANVMGHEIGHALASHTREKMSVAMGAGIGATILAALASRGSSDRGSFNRSMEVTQTAAALAVTLPNSRDAENEADQIGIELAARAGYDPRAAVSLWQKMAAEGGTPPEFMSTHPSPQNRIRNLQQLVAKVDPLYEAAKKGRTTADIPVFVGFTANERPAHSATAEEYAARVADEPEVMTFVSELFEPFRAGKAQLTCTAECALAYGAQRSRWKQLHTKRAWRDLAVAVMRTGYANDLSYFLLAEAATGLGLGDAARNYRAKAAEERRAGRTCTGVPDTCSGFEPVPDARAKPP